MIALDELTYFNKRIKLIANNSSSLEERTMASIVMIYLTNISAQLSNIPKQEFEQLCIQQEKLEKQTEKDNT